MPDSPVYRIGAAALLVVALALMAAIYQERDLREELDAQRQRRHELEQLLATRSEQLDGALGKIHELRPDAAD